MADQQRAVVPHAITSLRGTARGQPRCGAALAACAAVWRARTGVAISWDAPERAPGGIGQLARHHDLIVLQHAQIGAAVRDGLLLPLNSPRRVADIVRLAGQSVGESFTSYRLGGDQWALPLDASAQMQAWRPDRLAVPPRSWDGLLDLARRGRVLLPLRPPQSLLVFFTLAANLGQPCAATGEGELNDPDFGASLLDRLRTLVAAIDPACFEMDAAAALDRLAEPDAAESCVPYVDGDARYARPGYRAARLAFTEPPVAGRQGPVGSVLGGAGIAVSAACAAPEAAVAAAFWLAGGEAQCGVYAAAGGQPGNAVAWHDAAVNAAAGDFYRDTWQTLDGAWVRPRHPGYLAFQHDAAECINAGLIAARPAGAVMAELNRLYAASFG